MSNFSDQVGKVSTNSPSHTTFHRSYGAAPQQFGTLYLPTPHEPPDFYPVVICIHGGFWRSPYDLTLMTPLARDMVQRGIAVWNIEYRRLGDPAGGWPGTFLDVAHAADLLTTLAPTYHLDLQHVVTLGHSAGGQLALWLAGRHNISPDSPLFSPSPLPLAGAISLAGVNDLARAWLLGLGGNAVSELLDGSPDERPARYAATSPATLVPLGVPHILMHGDNDNRVPLEISQSYAQYARAASDTVILLELPGADHFVLIDPTSDAWHQTIKALTKLLAQ